MTAKWVVRRVPAYKATPDNGPSLDFLLTLAQTRIDEENKLISTLDTKAGFALGSASLLTTGVAAFGKTVFDVAGKLAESDLRLADEPKAIIAVLVLGALFSFLFLVYSGYQAYRIRDIQALTEIRKVVKENLGGAEAETKAIILDTLGKIIEANEVEIEKKAAWTQRAVFTFFIETGFIALLITVQLIVSAQIIG